MPHVSSSKLKKETLNKLYKELGTVIQNSGKKSATSLFLLDFLTKTEKIMLSKRFALILMLEEGVPVTYISSSLKMSPSTVNKMSLKYEQGKFVNIISLSKKEKKDIWRILERILRAGLPPIAGRGRWNFLYKKS